MKIIITGGHLSPALAVINKLQSQNWQIFFIGRKYALEGETTVSAEYKTIEKLGVAFASLTTGRLQRSFTRYTLLSLLKTPIGFIQSFYYLLKFRPDIILSFGGYLAVPVALIGWMLRIPVVTHEQSVVPGLATKIISVIADRVCVSWPQSLDFFPKEKTTLTGNPIRIEVFMKKGANLIHLKGVNLPLIYITGGSLGAHAINEIVGEILPQLLEKYRIIHQCGDSEMFKDYEILNTKYLILNTKLRSRYYLTKYVNSQDIGWVLNKADLVISRAGANTVTELAALKKMAILIPLPWAGQNEQRENAQILEKAGTAKILPQEKLSAESLLALIDFMFENIDKFKSHGTKVSKLVNLQAAEELTRIVSEVVNEPKIQKASS